MQNTKYILKHKTYYKPKSKKAAMMPWRPIVRYACFNACFKRKNPNELLQPIMWNQTIQFIPPITQGQVIKVYDGDTITIASRMPIPESPLYRFSVRLAGIDAPEIKGKSEEEKESALKAREALSNLLLHKVVELRNVKTEKYGRLLADVYLNDLHINQWLLDQKLAVPYDGGTKISPDSWLQYNNNSTHTHP